MADVRLGGEGSVARLPVAFGSRFCALVRVQDFTIAGGRL